MRKSSTTLNFNYGSGVAVGTRWATAGFINGADGNLFWNRPFRVVDTTPSTSSSTGAISTTGGLGVIGAANIGGNAVITGTLTAGATTINGTLAMGANAVTGTGPNSALTYSASGTTASISVTTGAIVSAGGAGIAGAITAGGVVKTTDATASSTPITGSVITAGGVGIAKQLYVGLNATIGPIQVPGMITETMLTMRGSTSSGSSGPHITSYIAADQYPVSQLFNLGHDNIQLCFDCYGSTTGVLSSSNSGSNYRIAKSLTGLSFDYAIGVAVGTTITPITAGYIDTSGILNWNKKVVINAGSDVNGLDLAASHTNANLHVIQNTNSPLDKNIYRLQFRSRKQHFIIQQQ